MSENKNRILLIVAVVAGVAIVGKLSLSGQATGGGGCGGTDGEASDEVAQGPIDAGSSDPTDDPTTDPDDPMSDLNL